MLNLTNLLMSYNAYKAILIVLIVLMVIAALAAIVFVLLQPANSTGIDAIGGSSETFFGKNKGKSIEAKMKKWTWICLAILAILAIAFFIIRGTSAFFS